MTIEILNSIKEGLQEISLCSLFISQINADKADTKYALMFSPGMKEFMFLQYAQPGDKWHKKAEEINGWINIAFCSLIDLVVGGEEDRITSELEHLFEQQQQMNNDNQ